MRVLVAEAAWENTVRETFANEPTTELLGVAADGLQAVAMTLSLQPDVAVIDARLPRIDGFEATRRIMSERPTPIVMVAADTDADAIHISMEALRAGALTTVPKPKNAGRVGDGAQGSALVKAVHMMAGVKLVRRWTDGLQPSIRQASPDEEIVPASQPAVVAVGASTGGPAALYRIFSALSPPFALPILVTQHVSRGFVRGMATWLNEAGPITVKVAEHGERLRRGTAYVAGDDRHLTVTRAATIALTDAAPEHGHRPSASVMFRSVAEAFGSRALTLILTGMGRDGIEGLTAVHDAGGIVVAQDEATCSVFGMPKAAIDAGIADVVLPLEAIARQLMLVPQAR